MKKVLLMLSVLSLFVFGGLSAQDRTVSGKITSAEDNSSLPGVNVILKGTTIGTVTDIDGSYKLAIPQDGGVLVFSFIGLETQEITIGSRSTIDVNMATDVTQLGEVVVTALGMVREAATVTYATQTVEAEALNITQDTNIKTALAGKVAGVQINGQAGSKLGQAGKIRIRGAISLTTDNDPLYVVDGVPTSNPNDIDMDNVASVNVLKGPNATALYGQRGDAGVVVITTKRGGGALSVEIASSTTWDKVAYGMPKMQNEYGQGYDGEASFGTFDNSLEGGPAEFDINNGKRYIAWDNNYADESWGAKFDGQDYAPWYSWWPDSPYYGQTAKWEAQPDNIKNFYDTGVTLKNSVSVGGGNDLFKARVTYTNLNQSGITPYTSYVKNFINSNFTFKPIDKLTISSNIRFANSTTEGDYDDGYGNQTSGSMNSWFNRQLDGNKLRELKDLKTMNGHSASWNWWGPDYYTFGGGFEKPAFWYNPVTFQEQYTKTRTNHNYVFQLSAAYALTENWDVSVTASRNVTQYRYENFLPFSLSNSSAPELYNSWSNSFGKYDRNDAENNYTGMIKYQNNFGDFDLNAFIGGQIRENSYRRISTQMPDGAKTGGLIIPDVYTFSNAGIVPTTSTYEWDKKVNSIYGNVSLGYRNFLYLDASVRQDWSSALPADKNGYLYPSVGASFIFTEIIGGFDVLSSGKLRGGWAQVGNDVDALRIDPTYNTASQAFGGSQIVMNNYTQAVDPNIKPSTNTSMEIGFDTRWLSGRLGLSLTYYDENRKDEIIPISISRGSGYDTYLTNAGASSRRGVEITFDADILRSNNGFNWNLMFNFAKNNTTVDELPGGLKSITAPGGSGSFGFVTMIHELGNNWGQLRGTGFARDANGDKIIQSNGLYKTEQDQYLGSVLPDFTGGIINTLSYKGFSLLAAMDYQVGGKFFSLTEMWGRYSGLLEPTAAINDRGANVRDDVATENGGVHVTGVLEGGGAYDDYVPATSYFSQWYGNRLAEPFVHEASYLKLRDVSLTYDFTKLINADFIKGLTLSFVGRNLVMIAVAKDNENRWDPSEMSQTYGENGQLPGTRSYGVNLRVTF
jgi:TonB-linked SusC/RagA family outer membrane protein